MIYTGRISEDKNLDFLISVYRKLLMENPDLNLIMIGDGPYMNTLKTKCSNLNNIFFHGKLDHQALPLSLSGCDIFVFPSNTDTFGMSVLEAQSCGLPAVVSDAGGPNNKGRNNRIRGALK